LGIGQAMPAPAQKLPAGPRQHGWPEAPQPEHAPETHVPPDMQEAPEATQRWLSQQPPEAGQTLPAQHG
jgi:hypothetical protein